MNNSSFLVKASLIASLIASAQSYAQTLPDEINHPQYLKVYQNLQTILNAKTAEYAQLAAQKEEILKVIAQMEKDSVALPARNEELRRQIEVRQQELSRLESEIQGLEGVLAKVLEDLRRADNVINQLTRDIQEEGGRAQAMGAQRQAVAQDLARRNMILQKHVQDENNSIQRYNNLTVEIQVAQKNAADREQDRRALFAEVEHNKKQITISRNQINQNNSAVATKKNQLSSAQTQLPGVKTELATNEAKLPGLDQNLAPKKTKLGELKADLASRSPEVTRLEKENAELQAKITSTKQKIDATGITAQQAKKATLEKQVADLEASINNLSASIVALKERMKPDLGRDNELRTQLREARRTGDQAAIRRLTAENELLQQRLAPQRAELTKLEKQHEQASLNIIPKRSELKAVADALPTLETQVAGLQAEITAAQEKIKANQVVINERNAANAGLIKEIADLEALIKTLQAERDGVAQKIQTLKGQEASLTQQIASLSGEIQKLEKETVALAAGITAMEKTIMDYPMANRRLELNIGKLNELIVAKSQDARREQQFMARIQQERLASERDVAAVQGQLAQADANLEQSARLSRALQGKLSEEQQNRAVLARYNQDSVQKYDALKAQKAQAEAAVDGASKEISVNDQDIASLATLLPQKRSELGTLEPKVANADAARAKADADANNANGKYQDRLSLYQQHLVAAQSLGAERAQVGSVDGDKVGRVDARTQAIKMATENAAAQGKWEALLRGYVRGEIAGFDSGFDVGMASEADASRGNREGEAAGALRAQNQAEHVMKPQFYLEEMDRRLSEEEVKLRQAISTAQAAPKSMAAIKALAKKIVVDIPELTGEELNRSRSIPSALDAMIEQAQAELREILKRRQQLADARSSYTILSAGANAANPNCSGVYKNVKDFLEACRASYGERYQLLFSSAHYNAFQSEYPATFGAQIASTFNSELGRLYQSYVNEATNVGKQVGVAQGQKEVYRLSFERAERSSYDGRLPVEEERVSQESLAMVDQFLAQNAALTLKGEPKLLTSSAYGISPGASVNLSLILKNIGGVASLGDSTLRITEASSNLILARRDAPVGSVAARSASALNVLPVVISDNAVPGSRIILAGQIVHPGNQYRANRVEEFRLETIVGVNPSVTTTFDFDTSPKVAGIFGGIKEHEIEVKLAPKFAGVENLEVTLAEVGTNFVTVLTQPIQTGALSKGSAKKLSLNYKMSKAAKGKALTVRVSVKYQGAIVESYDLKIQAH